MQELPEKLSSLRTRGVGDSRVNRQPQVPQGQYGVPPQPGRPVTYVGPPPQGQYP